MKILYAEDNPQDADLTRSHFAAYAPEFELQVVTTGAECLEHVRHSPPDLLLLDYRLPDADGADVLKTLLRVAPGLPVVFVTAVGDEELVARARRLGAADYVPKRGDYLESLPDMLRDVFDEHRRKQSRGLPAAAGSQRILYVEHLPMDIDLTVQHFADAAPHFELDVAHTCGDALVRLAQPDAYDLALIDVRMPDQNGLDFVREARRRRLPLPPFIMISGTGDEESAVEALRLGAADYVTKREGHLTQLTYRIDHAIAHDRLNRLREQLQTELVERKRAEAVMEQQTEELRASNDTLIRFNRVAVDRELRMIELKREVNDLCRTLGESPRHRIAEDDTSSPASAKDPG